MDYDAVSGWMVSESSLTVGYPVGVRYLIGGCGENPHALELGAELLKDISGVSVSELPPHKDSNQMGLQTTVMPSSKLDHNINVLLPNIVTF